MEERLQKLINYFDKLNKELASPDIANDPGRLSEIAQKRSEIEPIVVKARNYFSLKKEVSEYEGVLQGDDAELKELASAELDGLKKSLKKLESELEMDLLPKDPDDRKDVIIEIRPAAGGEESELFAAEIMRMYIRYAESHGLKTSLLSSQSTAIGGMKYIALEVRGEKVYEKLKYESGVHRVQRIPETEKSGRIHTSTITVAVLPEAEESDVEIKSEDLRIDVFRSSGPGGQSVNTTDSAVRITHEPTGVVVTCQDEKSQHKNKAKALSILRSRIKEAEEEKQRQERGEERKSQIGSGDRSEKIRTYNFPQDRVTDHRINQTWHSLPDILDGNIGSIIKALQEEDKKRKLEKLK